MTDNATLNLIFASAFSNLMKFACTQLNGLTHYMFCSFNSVILTKWTSELQRFLPNKHVLKIIYDE